MIIIPLGLSLIFHLLIIVIFRAVWLVKRKIYDQA